MKSSSLDPPSLPPKNKTKERKRKEREGLAELARNWIRTEQLAHTIKNPARDYIIALRFHTSMWLPPKKHSVTLNCATGSGGGVLLNDVNLSYFHT